MSPLRAVRCYLAFAVFFASSCALVSAQTPTDRQYLHGAWKMQSSCKESAKGEQISVAGFNTEQWVSADVPGTVVGAQVTAKVLPDPDYGLNLKQFPGFDANRHSLFANMDMPADSPYRCSFWFRTEFDSSKDAAKQATWLHFLGINYRANIWVNGKKIGDQADVAGAYRTFEFPLKDALRVDGTNALAVEVFAPQKYDLGL